MPRCTDALRDSPLWDSTLLLIVYDEHGGIHDHVTPPDLCTGSRVSSGTPVYRSALRVRPSRRSRAGGVRVAIYQSRHHHQASVRSLLDRRDRQEVVLPGQETVQLARSAAATFDDVLNLPIGQPRPERLVPPDPVVALPNRRTANIPPAVRKPTDLAIAMARAMEYSMNILGVQPTMKVSQIYTAQDATDYLEEAAALMKAKG